MNDKYKLRYLVPRWLTFNAKANEQKLTHKEAIELYDVYSRKLEFHSPRMYHINNKWVGTFRIKLKNPILKGSRRYKLPMMSLEIHTTQCNANIFTDVKDELEGYPYDMFIDMASKLRNPDSDDSSFFFHQIKDGRIAIHPHISNDGNPCLGDFSGPWSMSLQNNNLMMLVQVANSFLNNWTRRDCYWDINRSYETYMSHSTGSFANI